MKPVIYTPVGSQFRINFGGVSSIAAMTAISWRKSFFKSLKLLTEVWFLLVVAFCFMKPMATCHSSLWAHYLLSSIGPHIQTVNSVYFIAQSHSCSLHHPCWHWPSGIPDFSLYMHACTLLSRSPLCTSGLLRLFVDKHTTAISSSALLFLDCSSK